MSYLFLYAFERCCDIQKPIGVVVFEAPKGTVIPEIGITGSAIGKSGIQILIDFERKFAKQKFAAELSSSIAHETVHLVRGNTICYNSSPLGLISLCGYRKNMKFFSL